MRDNTRVGLFIGSVIFSILFTAALATAGGGGGPQSPQEQEMPGGGQAMPGGQMTPGRQGLYGQRPSPAYTMCAGNVPPAGMVVTATGNSPDCAGPCTARKVEPVHGPVMIICAHQPVPDNYDLESITTSPACKCIGDEDNAYVIRISKAPTTRGTPGFAQPGQSTSP